MILDSRAATHLVDSLDILVPSTFKPIDPNNTIEASTQALPIVG
jgi:hypothetical protein